MPSIEELGRKVKGKYPGTYDDLDDRDVGTRVKAKFPGSYDDFSDEPAGKTLGGGVMGAVADLGIGAAKGVASTVAGASALGEKMLQAPSKAVGVGVQKPLGQQVRESGKLEPKGTAQKIGFGAEQVGEFFLPGGAVGKTAKVIEKGLGVAKAAEGAGLLSKAAKGVGRLGIRSGLEAAAVGGQTAVQTGGDVEKAKESAKFGAVVPAVIAPLKGAGRLLQREPERLMGKALGFTKTQVRNLDKLASENSAYSGIKDFALKHGFGGSREQIAQQVEDRFAELTKGSKPETLAAIRELIPNRFKPAFAHLQDVYDVPGQENVLKEINALAKKKSLTASELDRVRSLMDNSLPTGAYKGAEPVKTEGLQNLIDPMRRTLERLDRSGTIKRVNQDIRVLYQMRKAAEHAKSGGVEGAAAFKTLMRGGATQVLTALGVPLPKIATIPYVVYQGATDFPQVASYIAQKLKGAQGAIPEGIPLLLRKALERWK